MFQSHNGSIATPMGVLIQSKSSDCFNPIMVRLRRSVPVKTVDVTKFQSHNGSIATNVDRETAALAGVSIP